MNRFIVDKETSNLVGSKENGEICDKIGKGDFIVCECEDENDQDNYYVVGLVHNFWRIATSKKRIDRMITTDSILAGDPNIEINFNPIFRLDLDNFSLIPTRIDHLFASQYRLTLKQTLFDFEKLVVDECILEYLD